jgi:hypothetical protein
VANTENNEKNLPLFVIWYDLYPCNLSSLRVELSKLKQDDAMYSTDSTYKLSDQIPIEILLEHKKYEFNDDLSV